MGLSAPAAPGADDARGYRHAPRRVRRAHDRGVPRARDIASAGVLPPAPDVRTDLLVPTDHHTFCEFKGVAHYVDLVLPGATVRDVAWYYPDPIESYEDIAGYFAFYPGRVDECTVAGEQVTPQASDFYGGWITSEIIGPFKS
jgi:hypothetical protein